MNASESFAETDETLISFPDPHAHALSIRATALTFADPVSRQLLDCIQRIAPSEANVLIIGETGTGKELVARHIHALSVRAQGPFVPVNCGAFTENLIESELFGHERGAFTGANSNRAGWFEAAKGGTLFLDEIGDLPLSAQVKLLRVLQEREVVRLGARTATPIDVRLLAATNVDLAAAVRAGRFREDLYYRLDVASIQLKPLRERLGDILPLARFFLERYRKRIGGIEKTLSSSAERALLNYSWPGNIRELENVIHHAVLLSRGSEISPEDLELHASTGNKIAAGTETIEPQVAGDFKRLRDILVQTYEQGMDDLYQRIDQAVIDSAYQYCECNQVQTAKLLGISRNVLRHKLKAYGQLPDKS